MISIQDKTIAITGACGGIGRALCETLGSAGNRIIVLDNNHATAHDLVRHLERNGMTATPCVVDITDAAAVRAAFQDATTKAGEVDILVNNAGALTGLKGSRSLNLGRMTPEVWDADVRLNLNGAYHCVEGVRESMIRRGGGVIINIGSVNSMLTYGCPAYSAAKAGLVSYTKALATEFGRHNIRANAVLPGTVKTEAWETMEAANPGVFDQLLQWYPLRRIATPQDIANAVLFLASDAAGSISGAVLTVDAGLTAGNGPMAEAITSAPF
ncbi:SDR family oxidoreductase [Burkholderia pseudomallei]|uniref:3-beta hydroxysteroid dehydrogenase/isomerase family protein n=1 Tax=Burkholderia pseudomallei TaxID=28450 RepID=A0AA40JJM4_BURPE|nr:SDR family oxidoreductase [Burkholderia pseudomallei]KGS74137.1 3-beta hydroxysteroid dehydrogenase/isomerase family protein [Burkholderia pseudomallei MSHR5596]KGX17192.1 3-beta hydroxysteroid dehydrogenase/isomerase family protein [Burkholderia pseudomallei]